MPSRYDSLMSDASIEGLAAALDLQTVRVVRQVAEHGSLTAAAEALGYSQPAVSQQLRRFEERTGIALVERVGRGIRLTAVGPRARAPCQRGRDRARGRRRRARRDPGPACRTGAARRVPLGVGDARAEAHRRARRRAPGRRRDVRRGRAARGGRRRARRPRRPRASRSATRATATTPTGRAPAGSTSARTATSRSGSCCPPGIRPRDPTSSTSPARATTPGSPDARAAAATCSSSPATAGFTPRIAFETDNFVAVEGMVAQGLGVALLPALALAASPRHPGSS